MTLECISLVVKPFTIVNPTVIQAMNMAWQTDDTGLGLVTCSRQSKPEPQWAFSLHLHMQC